jgi:hypothetical protein
MASVAVQLQLPSAADVHRTLKIDLQGFSAYLAGRDWPEVQGNLRLDF